MGINNLLIICFFNEFLRNIPFKKMHGIIFLATIFDIKRDPKGGNSKVWGPHMAVFMPTQVKL
jgi:hypothetical protein